MKRGCIIGSIAVVFACFAFGIGALIYNYCRDQQAAAPFKVIADQARSACSRCSTADPNSTVPYPSGKILAVYLTGDAIGSILTDKTLTDTIATSPADIGILVCVGERDKYVAGHYTGGDPAYRISRDVCVVDWDSGEVLYKTTLRGSSPPAAKTKGGMDTGSDPESYELKEFIRKLPVK